MAENNDNDNQPTPPGQAFFDNWPLLLVLSILLSGALYNVWGLAEILSLPVP